MFCRIFNAYIEFNGRAVVNFQIVEFDGVGNEFIIYKHAVVAYGYFFK